MKTGWSEPVSAPRADVEKAMLVEAEVPQLLVPVVTNMLQESVPKMRDVESTDVARIYFWDTRWLGLKDDAGAKALVKAQRVDVLRKTELAPGVKVRVCKRCGSAIEDHVGRETPLWLQAGQRLCVCYSYWMLT